MRHTQHPGIVLSPPREEFITIAIDVSAQFTVRTALLSQVSVCSCICVVSPKQTTDRSPTEYSTRTPEKRKPRTTHELKVHWPSASVLVLRRVSVVYRPSVVRTQKHQPGIWHSQPAFHSPSTFIQSSCLSCREECFHTIRNMQATQQAVHTGKQPQLRVLRLKLIPMSAANTESPACAPVGLCVRY